ncbi:MAG TPA: hypothetical protein VI790_05075 [Candidatus Nanoarchaeia archaeon]|nr:hypothetical protein [Candidatus Nanoarchaeia archaeon]
MSESIKQVLSSYSIRELLFGEYKVTIGVNNFSSYKNGLVVYNSFAIISKDSINHLFLADIDANWVLSSVREGDFYDFVLGNFDFERVSDLGASNVSLSLINGLYSLIKGDLNKEADDNLRINNRLKEIDLSLRSLLIKK